MRRYRIPTYCNLTISLKTALLRHSVLLVVLCKGIRPLLSQEKINGWWDTPTLSHNNINSIVIVRGTCRRCVSLSPPNGYCTVGSTLPAHNQCISNNTPLQSFGVRCGRRQLHSAGLDTTVRAVLYTQYISNVYPPETNPKMGHTEQYSGHG